MDAEERGDLVSVLYDEAKSLEDKITRKLTARKGKSRAREMAVEKAGRWYRTAMGQETPFGTVVEQFEGDKGKRLSISSRNNLKTAVKEFKEFAGADVSMEEVDRRLVADFVTKFLPGKTGPKAPEGQGPATIRKKVSQLTQVWRWAAQRGVLPYSKDTPWDEQGPSAKEVGAAKSTRRPFTPNETRKLFAAAPTGEALGDACRVALTCGVRLEEIASLDAAQVAEGGRYYTITKGKTSNAARIVPLVGVAQGVIRARLKKVNGVGPLFPDVPLRKSTGKRGGALSQAFTRLRRTELGAHTDGEFAPATSGPGSQEGTVRKRPCCRAPIACPRISSRSLGNISAQNFSPSGSPQ
jgi:integrase